MEMRWSGVFVLVLALAGYGCGTSANGGDIGGGGDGGDGGMGGDTGMGGGGGMGGAPDLCDGVVCDDDNECTDDSCDPADGMCLFEDVVDGTSCDFGGLPGVCMSGVCEDAMLCDSVDCSDGNECTDDVCDPQDGSCDNPAVPDGTVCDATGLPGECTAGICEALCNPAAGLSVMLPTSGAPTPTYSSLADGFTISAAGCEALPKCDVTFSDPRGIGANAYAAALRIDPGDSLEINFFDMEGNARTASNVEISLYPNGVAGTVEIVVDGQAPATMMAIPGTSLALPGTGHSFQVTLTNTVPTAFHFWSVLSYDHDCL